MFGGEKKKMCGVVEFIMHLVSQIVLVRNIIREQTVEEGDPELERK